MNSIIKYVFAVALMVPGVAFAGAMDDGMMMDMTTPMMEVDVMGDMSPYPTTYGTIYEVMPSMSGERILIIEDVQTENAPSNVPFVTVESATGARMMVDASFVGVQLRVEDFATYDDYRAAVRLQRQLRARRIQTVVDNSTRSITE